MSSGNLFVLLGILVLLHRGQQFSDFVGFIMSYPGLCGFLDSPFSSSGQLLCTSWNWKFHYCILEQLK